VNVEREVFIYGQTYKVKGDDPRRIEAAADYLNSKMVEVLGDPSQGLSTRGAVLAALNVADEWFTTREELERIISELGGRVDELIGLLPE